MIHRHSLLAAAGLIAVAGLAGAQQPAPPAPSFAPSNLTDKGVRSMAASCAACHGTEGRVATGSSLAALAGRPSQDTRTALQQFRDGKKPATLMHQIAKGYSDAEIAALADYFSKQPR